MVKSITQGKDTYTLRLGIVIFKGLPIKYMKKE